jgi:hypothetical protein
MLAPAIVAAVLCVAGLLGLRWLSGNRPTLAREAPTTAATEEEPPLPFEEPTPSEMTPEERLLREIFKEPKKENEKAGH